MDNFIPTDPFVKARLRMVAEQLRDRGIRDERVLQAMATVPRHEFVPPEAWAEAYEDHPLPIGEGQTISQPYIVAFMIEALGVAANHQVLEIGTGTGYEAAVLSLLAARVFSVERVASLARRARENFARLDRIRGRCIREAAGLFKPGGDSSGHSNSETALGYRNIEVIVGDGSEGLPQSAPFQRIIVAAAAAAVPDALLQQLDEDGKLILPTGSAELQELQLFHKTAGQFSLTNLGGCRFVPLIGS